MTPTQKLLGKLPKKYHDRVVSLEAEEDLCDGCKYMLKNKDELKQIVADYIADLIDYDCEEYEE